MNKNFRNLTLCFYTYFGSLLSLFLYVYLMEATSNSLPHSLSVAFGVAWAVIFIGAWFLYMINIGKLATQAKKNATLWVLGALLFKIIGILITYYRMKAVAIRNGWI